MLDILKRYSMASIFLILVIALMIIGTMGVMSFGDGMLENIEGIDMKPRGEDLIK